MVVPFFVVPFFVYIRESFAVILKEWITVDPANQSPPMKLSPKQQETALRYLTIHAPDLSELAYALGYSERTLEEFFQGRRPLTGLFVRRCADFLNVEPDEIHGEDLELLGKTPLSELFADTFPKILKQAKARARIAGYQIPPYVWDAVSSARFEVELRELTPDVLIKIAAAINEAVTAAADD